MDIKKKFGGSAWSLQKKCRRKCWVRTFFWELHFVIEENKFLSCVQRRTIVARIIKKYSKEKYFKNFFNGQIIDNLMIDTGKNWKLCLIDLYYNPFIFLTYLICMYKFDHCLILFNS